MGYYTPSCFCCRSLASDCDFISFAVCVCPHSALPSRSSILNYPTEYNWCPYSHYNLSIYGQVKEGEEAEVVGGGRLLVHTLRIEKKDEHHPNWWPKTVLTHSLAQQSTTILYFGGGQMSLSQQKAVRMTKKRLEEVEQKLAKAVLHIRIEK